MPFKGLSWASCSAFHITAGHHCSAFTDDDADDDDDGDDEAEDDEDDDGDHWALKISWASIMLSLHRLAGHHAQPCKYMSII